MTASEAAEKRFILELRCGGSLCKEEGRFRSRTQTESLRMARAAGWSVNLESDCPWCPNCKKTKRKAPDTWREWHNLWKKPRIAEAEGLE